MSEPIDNTSLIIKDEDNTPKEISISDENSEPKQSKTKANSTRKQLLNLAKKFALDGAIVETINQAPIEDRARKRERLSHFRKQQNMEAIMLKALAFCSEQDIANRSDQDWFNSYIELAEDISNPTMQELWAKILAGEIHHSGTYSLKALQVFRSMSIDDAKLFAKACSLAVTDQSRKNLRILSGSYQQPGILNMFDKKRLQNVNLSRFGLQHSDLLHLAQNNLLFSQESETNILDKSSTLNFIYNGLGLVIKAKKSNCILKFYKFTTIGVELSHLIKDKPNEEFKENLQQQLSHHFLVT